MVRVAIYARCSTNESRQDVENQTTICERYCKAHGWDYQTFQEYESAYRARSRKIFEDVLERVRLREFDGLMVYMLDRFSRETPTKIVSDLHRIVEQDGCRFISIKENIDSQNEMWQIVMMIFAYMANNFSRMLGIRVREGIEHKKSKGEYRGGRPQKRIDTGRLKKVVKDRTLSLRQIAMAYNHSLPKKQQISYVSVKRLLQKYHSDFTGGKGPKLTVK